MPVRFICKEPIADLPKQKVNSRAQVEIRTAGFLKEYFGFRGIQIKHHNQLGHKEQCNAPWKPNSSGFKQRRK